MKLYIILGLACIFLHQASCYGDGGGRDRGSRGGRGGGDGGRGGGGRGGGGRGGGGRGGGGRGGGGGHNSGHYGGNEQHACATTLNRVIIISDNMSDCNPTQLCVGRCFSYPLSFWPNVQSLTLTKNDYVVVVPGPTSSPNTASIIAGAPYIVTVAGVANLYGATTPVPTPDTNNVAASNTAIKTLGSVAATANVFDWAVDSATFQNGHGGYGNSNAQASFQRLCDYVNQKLGFVTTTG